MNKSQEMILAAYLNEYNNGDKLQDGGIVLSSEQIAEDLYDMCELNNDDVSEFMYQQGFTFARIKDDEYSYIHGWILNPKDKE